MTQDPTASAAQTPELPPSTLPAVSYSIRDCASEEQGTRLAYLLNDALRALSRAFDLSALVGVTAGFDYPAALASIDLGYETSRIPEPSSDFAHGFAMTVSVMRDGRRRSHIVLNAAALIWLEGGESDPTGDDFRLALYVLAHECAHVESNSLFDRAFPDRARLQPSPDVVDACRWQVIHACWDEYIACRRSGGFGRDPTHDHAETFLRALEGTRARASQRIREYRIHGDHRRVLLEVYGAYGTLMRYASYFLGSMEGWRHTLSAFPQVERALHDHRFAPVFEQLGTLCNSIAEDYGRWTSMKPFEAIGDLAATIVADAGVTATAIGDGRFWIDVPFTADTL